MIQEGGKYYLKYEKLKNQQQIDKLEKDMLKRYHSMTQIQDKLSDLWKTRLFVTSKLLNFLQEQNSKMLLL